MTGIIIDFAHQKLVKPTNINNNIPTYSNYTVIKYPGGPTISTEKITTIYYMSASTTKSTTTSTKSTSYVTTTPFDYFRKLILLSEPLWNVFLLQKLLNFANSVLNIQSVHIAVVETMP